MKIAIGSDTSGLPLKEALKTYLDSRQIPYEDFSNSGEEVSQYPHVAERVSKAVLSGRAERGILVCGNGAGMCIAANKFPGIRAVLCSEPYTAITSRRYNNTNVLCLGARVVGSGLASMILEGWLSAAFDGQANQAQLDSITRMEQRNAPPAALPAAPALPPDQELTRKLEDTRPTRAQD